MGLTIGHGLGIPFSKPKLWSSYWASQPEVLFFGLYSEISAGKMPNKVTGATDFLTVDGSAGSETYQCPNTAAYIAADTDYIWFKTDTTQRTTTTAELIGYDLQKTPIYYLDDAPNSIVAILILKAGEVLSATKMDKLHADFRLPILWDGVWSDLGYAKSNRPISQQYLWIPEPVLLAELLDGNTVGWYDFTDISTITKDGNNLVSAWNDKLGSGHDLVQATGTKQPLCQATGILFDGSSDFLKTAPFTFVRPETFYLVLKAITTTNFDYVLDGNANQSIYLYEDATGAIRTAVTNGLSVTLDQWYIIRLRYGLANSTLIFNNSNTYNGAAFGTDAGGITLGAWGGGGQNANVEVKELICRKTDDDATTQLAIYNYLANKYGLQTI